MSLSILFGPIFLELLVVGWIDFKTKKISNKWSFVNLLLGAIFHSSFRSLYPLTWEIFIFPLGFIVIGFLLYLIGVMGAGDSKYLASLFLIIPLEYHLLFFRKLVICTILTGGILLVIRVFKERRQLKEFLYTKYWSGITATVRSRFSYAPVVTLAWLLVGFDVWR